MLGYWLSSGDVHSGNRASKLCVSWVYARRSVNPRGMVCVRVCVRVSVPSRKGGRRHVLSLRDFDVRSGLFRPRAAGHPPTPCMIESAYWNWILAAAAATAKAVVGTVAATAVKAVKAMDSDVLYDKSKKNCVVCRRNECYGRSTLTYREGD